MRSGGIFDMTPRLLQVHSSFFNPRSPRAGAVQGTDRGNVPCAWRSSIPFIFKNLVSKQLRLILFMKPVSDTDEISKAINVTIFPLG